MKSFWEFLLLEMLFSIAGGQSNQSQANLQRSMNKKEIIFRPHNKKLFESELHSTFEAKLFLINNFWSKTKQEKTRFN